VETLPLMVAYNSTALSKSVVNPPSAYDGVAEMIIHTADPHVSFGCSGSLLSDADPNADYVLTAAHCVTNGSGQLIATQVDLSWRNDTVTVSADASDITITVDPDWNGNFLVGNDLAIIKIDPLTAGLPRYDLHSGVELRQVFTKVGYGLPGIGSRGFDPNGDFGTLRQGQNRFDDTYGATSSQQSMLAYDFDSGRWINDTIGLLFGIRDRGLGTKEAFPAPGDSGGPAFLNGKIAGVTSFLMSIPLFDSVPGVNASFGEMGFDTRVSWFTDWINAQITPGSGQTSSRFAGFSSSLFRGVRPLGLALSADSIVVFTPDLGGFGFEITTPEESNQAPRRWKLAPSVVESFTNPDTENDFTA
jgi:hypothetical protein